MLHVRRTIALAAVVSLAITALSACSPVPDQGRQSIVHVPADASLAEAGSLIAEGGLILIEPGTYTETLEVRVDDVTVRGRDRESVILDGELRLSHGIVGSGARIAVENLTVRNYLQNGVLITGVTDENGAGVARGPDGYLPSDTPPPVPGYLVQYVTAHNNGLYGIYAFNRTGGVIRENLVSGGSDSGIYVGQCVDCNAWVTGNVAMHNAIGIELANASNVVISENRVVNNRVGISVVSNYLEAHGPSTKVRIAGNVIADNAQVRTPAQAAGAFGIGVGLGGTVDAIVHANRITGHPNVGVWVTSSEDFGPSDTRVTNNLWEFNTLDLAYTPTDRVAPAPQCIIDEGITTSVPSDIIFVGCGEVPNAFTYAQPEAPSGISFAEVPPPTPVPGLSEISDQPYALPDEILMPAIEELPIPEADYLAAR